MSFPSLGAAWADYAATLARHFRPNERELGHLKSVFMAGAMGAAGQIEAARREGRDVQAALVVLRMEIDQFMVDFGCGDIVAQLHRESEAAP